MKKIIQYFFPINSRKKIIRIAILLVIIILILTTVRKETASPVTETNLPPVVAVGTVSEVKNGNTARFIGTVRAVSEAQIQSELSGRVTAVYVEAGDEVSAGTILATLENSAQSASLLQAQGAYEAALAGAAQSEVSLTEARNNAVNTYRSAYTTTYTSVIDDIDIFFGDPNSLITPGVRINTSGDTAYLNETRKQLNTIFRTWRNNMTSIDSTTDLAVYLADAKNTVQTVIDVVDVLTIAAQRADNGDMLNGASVNSYTAELNTTRATLNATLASLKNAEELLKKAEINASTQSTDVSLANAQIKQALGTLRSAEANYEKTIFRTPIAGTVNSLRLNVGDYVSAFTQVAEVANNNALQISVFAGEKDLTQFKVGETVSINNSTDGVITSIAPAVDPVTLKTEIKIATESSELTNGNTVTISVPETYTEGPLKVPITAVKFSANNGVIFSVEDGRLVAHEVRIGEISGSLVTITEGITADMVFVFDARGLSEGEAVEAVRNTN